MKLMRTLFQAALLMVITGAFSQPLLALDYRNIPVDQAAVSSAPSSVVHATHLSVLAILTRLGSEFVGGVITLLMIILAGLAIWLAMPPQPVRVEADEQLPVEIPPLRPSPGRVTKF